MRTTSETLADKFFRCTHLPGIPAKRLHYQMRCANSTPSSFSSGNPTSSSEEKRYKTSRSPPPLDSASFAPPRTR